MAMQSACVTSAYPVQLTCSERVTCRPFDECLPAINRLSKGKNVSEFSFFESESESDI